MSDPAILRVMQTVPRHAFVSHPMSGRAYDDTPLPIGHGQTISQPYIVAEMTRQLRLGPDAKVLEIGTGSGYQAAVLAEITPHVYTIEIVPDLARSAARRLRDLGLVEKGDDGQLTSRSLMLVRFVPFVRGN